VHECRVDLSAAVRVLLITGIVLLAVSALTGFLQAREEAGSHAHTLWRVAHAGGTAGAVQLIALGAALVPLGTSLPGPALWAIVVGVAAGTWCFFVGPLLRALGAERAARRVNLLGALIAGPAYLALPLLLLR
jgi:hypothetical protein